MIPMCRGGCVLTSDSTSQTPVDSLPAHLLPWCAAACRCSSRRGSLRPASWFSNLDAVALQRAVVSFPGADADHPLDVGNEDLAVAYFAGLRRLHDGLDHLIDEITAHRHLDARLGDEVDHVFRSPIKLGVSALASETLYLGDGHTRYPDIGQRRPYVVEFEGLDDRGDEFHERALQLRGWRREGFCSFRAMTSNRGIPRSLRRLG